VGNSGPERAINTISPPVVNPLSPSSVSISYANSLFELVVQYTLADNAPYGSGVSELSGVVQINNVSGAQLDFHLFQYADLDLSVANDSVALSDFTSVPFLFVDATQTSGVFDRHSMIASEIESGLQGTGYEAGAPGTILGKLTDADTDNLANTASAGPGDVAYAFQYSFRFGTSPSDKSAQIGLNNQIRVTPVPEPASLSLILLGLLGLAGWRRAARH
jgi:hypothetical protein